MIFNSPRRGRVCPARNLPNTTLYTLINEKRGQPYGQSNLRARQRHTGRLFERRDRPPRRPDTAEIDAQVDDRLPELLTLDFSGVTFMDSSGVGLILGRGRHVSALGGRLTVQNPPRAVRRMLDLAHITYA